MTCLGCHGQIGEGDGTTRGLCLVCYRATRYAIRRGRITDQELLDRGLILPCEPRGPRPKNAYTAMLCGRS